MTACPLSAITLKRVCPLDQAMDGDAYERLALPAQLDRPLTR